MKGRAVLGPAVAAMVSWSCGETGEAQHRDPYADTIAIEAVVLPEAPLLGTVAADTVVGFTGPGGRPFEVTRRTSLSDAHLYRRIGIRTFDLPLRTPPATLSQYPCTSCHEGLRVRTASAEPAHQNIVPVHPSLTADDCTSCHMAENVERLRLPGGGTAALDQAYRLCAQCHYAPVNAWAAGIHGKRLDGWGGRRVVMNCADCHDPHTPSPIDRIPFPGPKLLPRQGQP